jgi:PTH1 family peptidyl-tRNA hydrolase
MPHKELYLIAGLGNPGRNYLNTRHNAGFMVVDHLAGISAVSVNKKKSDSLWGRGTIAGVACILMKPTDYMNRSGHPVQQMSGYFKIKSERIIVIHDDIDLALGRVKIKEKGGDGGHKGIKSIIHTLGGGDFLRLRVGIGRGGESAERQSDVRQFDVTKHVLGRFRQDEKKILDRIIQTSGEGIESILCEGVKKAMNTFNVKI